MIVLDEFCTSHQIEISFIQSLEQHGLIQTIIVDRKKFLLMDELSYLERIIRLHRELNINPEGIDVVNNLLQEMEIMQNEISDLRNKLRFFEE